MGYVVVTNMNRLTWHKPECTSLNRVKKWKRKASDRSMAEFDKYRRDSIGGRYRYAFLAECKRCIAKPEPTPTFTRPEAKRIHKAAREAGIKAGEAVKPTPMIVYSPNDPVASIQGQPTEIDHKQPVYGVPDGVCGFAYVTVRPGNSSFARWLVKNRIGRTDSYAGGVLVSIHDHGQSLERKEKHAQAYAAVLNSEGINAFAHSRID